MAEFRIPEDRVGRLFKRNEGRSLGGSVRVITIETSDPRYPQIGHVQHELGIMNDQAFFFGWDIRHHYSSHEIEQAELFHLRFTAIFEPAGEECGTIYDDSTACPLCGAGRTQQSDLTLDLRKAPKTKDIAATIARDEWIISQRLAELMQDAGLTGFDLRRVRHKAKYDDDPIEFSDYPSGRMLIARAERFGIEPISTNWAFIVWVNRPEQREMLEEIDREHAKRKGRKAKRQGKPAPTWYQLIVTSKRTPTVPPTKFGLDPFDDDTKKTHICPKGHVSGLALLSEVSVKADQYDGSDVACSKNMVGVRGGVLAPSPILLISPRFHRLLGENDVEGYRAEVAYLR